MRAKFEDAVAEADCARRDLADVKASMGNSDAAYKRQIADLEASLADALRKKNKERVARDKKLTMNMQREMEKALKDFFRSVTLHSEAAAFSSMRKPVRPRMRHLQCRRLHMRKGLMV